MPALVLQASGKRGVGLQLQPSTPAGDAFTNDGTIRIFVQVPPGRPVSLLIHVPAVVDGDLKVPDRTYQLPPNGLWMLGPFPPEVYNQPDGTVTLIADGPFLWSPFIP